MKPASSLLLRRRRVVRRRSGVRPPALDRPDCGPAPEVVVDLRQPKYEHSPEQKAVAGRESGPAQVGSRHALHGDLPCEIVDRAAATTLVRVVRILRPPVIAAATPAARILQA